MKKKGIKRKLLEAVILVVVVTVLLTSVIKIISDTAFRDKTEKLLIEQAKDSTKVFVSGQTDSANEQLVNLTEKMTRAASFCEYIYEHPDEFVAKHNRRPSEFPEDTTGVTFHWSAFSEEDVDSEELIKEADLLSALEGEFYSLSLSSSMIQSLYVATSTHINIGYDENVLAKVGSFYSPIESGALWYSKPFETGGVYISDAYSDTFGRGNLITVSAPYKVDGEVHGVIGADINIQKIKESILDIDMSGISGYSVLLTANGEPISSDSKQESVTSENVFETGSKDIISEMMSAQNGMIETEIGGSDKYIVYDTIKSTGWKLAVVISVDDIIAPTRTINDLILKIAIVTVIVSLLLLAGMIFIVGRFCRRFTKPIESLTEDVAKIGEGNLDYVSEIHTGDEIEMLSDSFENMTVSLKEYIENLTEMTAENERIGAELGVATRIQASMLPCIFPPFPDRDEFDIFATMNPAKEVGGDFYDFFMVDKNNLAIVMADVSGKGVPAALFMVIAKTLIKDHTNPDEDLGSVFTKVNEILCESNSGGMFVTAFEGVLNLVTGELRYVNAGHELPFICRNDGTYELYKIKPGFVLAGMEGMKYRSGSVMLDPGDKVFEYTDGVTEATNGNNELYGMDRLGKVLNENSDKSPSDLLPCIKADIDLFVGEAPQFDDITMLCLEYRKRGEEQ